MCVHPEHGGGPYWKNPLLQGEYTHYIGACIFTRDGVKILTHQIFVLDLTQDCLTTTALTIDYPALTTPIERLERL